jgi:hypothetical protein
MSTDIVPRKLDTTLKMKVLAYMARGERYQAIIDMLQKDHGISYTMGGLSLLRKRHTETISEMERIVLEQEMADTSTIRNKSLKLLNRKLDQASTDELEMAALDQQYRDGNLDLATYKRKKQGLLRLNIKELTEVSREMAAQQRLALGSKKNTPGPDALPAGGMDPAAIEQLTTAIKDGNTVELTKLVFNP